MLSAATAHIEILQVQPRKQSTDELLFIASAALLNLPLPYPRSPPDPASHGMSYADASRAARSAAPPAPAATATAATMAATTTTTTNPTMSTAVATPADQLLLNAEAERQWLAYISGDAHTPPDLRQLATCTEVHTRFVNHLKGITGPHGKLHRFLRHIKTYFARARAFRASHLRTVAAARQAALEFLANAPATIAAEDSKRALARARERGAAAAARRRGDNDDSDSDSDGGSDGGNDDGSGSGSRRRRKRRRNSRAHGDDNSSSTGAVDRLIAYLQTVDSPARSRQRMSARNDAITCKHNHIVIIEQRLQTCTDDDARAKYAQLLEQFEGELVELLTAEAEASSSSSSSTSSSSTL